MAGCALPWVAPGCRVQQAQGEQVLEGALPGEERPGETAKQQALVQPRVETAKNSAH